VGGDGGLRFETGSGWTPLRWPYTRPVYGIGGSASDLAFAGGSSALTQLVRPIACGVASNETVCDDRWDDDCDGLTDGADPDCPAPPAESCANGIDDDEDGLTDCADPECATTTYCHRGGICQPRIPIACGDSLVAGVTAAAAKIDIYPCAARAELGGEATYKLTLAAAATVTATLASASDVDLIAVGGDASGGCEPWTSCLAASTSPGSGDETVTFAAPAGTSWIVVDSPTAFAASFTLSITCN
jgi:hypothetical protein